MRILAALSLLAYAAVAPAPAWAGKLVFTAEKGDEIVPTPQRPSQIVFISRKNLNKSYDFTYKESFVPKIVEAASSGPLQ